MMGFILFITFIGMLGLGVAFICVLRWLDVRLDRIEGIQRHSIEQQDKIILNDTALLATFLDAQRSLVVQVPLRTVVHAVRNVDSHIKKNGLPIPEPAKNMTTEERYEAGLVQSVIEMSGVPDGAAIADSLIDDYT